MSKEFNFENARNRFKTSLKEDIENNKSENVPTFLAVFKTLTGTDADKRTASDQALRDIVSDSTKAFSNSTTSSQSQTVEKCVKAITAAVAVAKQVYCTASLPFMLLGDILDCLTLDACDPVFCFIEERVAIWKSPQFYTAGKNYLLRMCNDLLRRLSQAKNNVFCGRIQLFLARLFPLSEKSALNLVSQFNLDNITQYSESENEDGNDKSAKSSNKQNEEKLSVGDELWLDGATEEMEVDQTKEKESVKEKQTSIVDSELYKNVWGLQDFFRNPPQCYHKEAWDKMTTRAEAVFRVFSSYKLDEGGRSSSASSQNNKAYFAKYLTSKKLIDLQLNDSMFRRQILTQMLILCQYLKGTVKFKSPSMILTTAQSEWVDSTTSTVYKLLEETPPHGKHFAKYIKNLLQREEFWIEWKNESCPSFIKTKAKTDINQPLSSPPAKKKRTSLPDASSFPVKKKSTIAQDFVSGKPLGLGSAELTRLWSLCEDNMAACKSEKRCFLPKTADFFAESIEYMDPKNMVEEEYMPYNDGNFQWKALRLLSQKSSLFFQSQPSVLQFKSVPQYLKGVIQKLGEEIAPVVEEELNVKEDEAFESQSKEEGEPEAEEPMNDDNGQEEEEGNESDELDNEEDDVDNDANILNDDSQQEDLDSADEDALLEEPTPAGNSLTSDEVTSIAQKLGADWKTLAPHLDLKASDIKDIQEDSEDFILQARQTLVTWQDRNRGSSTIGKEVILEALKKAGLDSKISL